MTRQAKRPADLDNRQLASLAKQASIAQVAFELISGLDERGSGDWWAPCPFHAEDSPSFHVRAHTGRYKCFGCGETGDVIALVQGLEGLAFREACLRLIGGHGAPHPASPPSRRPRMKTKSGRRPSATDVRALAETLRPVDQDTGVSAYLQERGLAPAEVATRLTLAGALPSGALCPPWAALGKRPWSAGPYRLLFPLYQPVSEAIASFRARCIDPGRTPKSVAGTGISTRNQVMADALGRHLLTERSLPPCWPSDEPLRVIVCEGDTDFLTLATYWPDEHPSPAVLGTVMGAWTEAIAECIPSRAVVEIRTDPDGAGDRMARQIAATLASRCDVQRVVPAGAA